MSKKWGILIVALSLATMFGCAKKSNSNASQEEKITSANSTVQDTNEGQEKAKGSEESEDNEKLDLEDEILAKKQQYIDRMEKIHEEYTRVLGEYDVGNLPTSELGAISVKTYQKYDEVLNDIYQDLKKYLPADEMRDIKQEQLAWIKEKERKEKEMKKIGTYIHVNQNLGAITRTRCEELLGYLTGEKVEVQSSDKSIDDIINGIYRVLGESRDEIDYVYSADDNYVLYDDLKNDYYIFQVDSYIDEGDFVTLDYNILVDKKNYEIYTYYPDGTMSKIGKIK
ncbi:lysozyme inhibitor LprI family protein [Asaccharospora irregularis]|uniref:Lysozyme inhibitor LprI-like N-terminal domain-containing protein n=1 Tax=Asaccharospora irregularis DSM 2635 TaxID=1121321 RepID=A0A1M5TRI3_9FIRM|nr:lysozyme inhibitor LprI family protein [Asaccharospora irregularis]SHH53270.1 Protein of unknown function [Asaccharospora irregularis DSM 2635]